VVFFFSSRRRHTRFSRDWSSDVCSSDLGGRGGKFELLRIPCDEPGLSPLEIRCNESQERYVLAVKDEDLARFDQICARERCPYAVVGEATEEMRLALGDEVFANKPVDLPMSELFGKPSQMD